MKELISDKTKIMSFFLNAVLASYDFGGVRTNSKKESLDSKKSNDDRYEARKIAQSLKEVHCIYPGDLYPLFRKPLFLIVDSSNSQAFKVGYIFCTCR